MPCSILLLLLSALYLLSSPCEPPAFLGRALRGSLLAPEEVEALQRDAPAALLYHLGEESGKNGKTPCPDPSASPTATAGPQVGPGARPRGRARGPASRRERGPASRRERGPDPSQPPPAMVPHPESPRILPEAPHVKAGTGTQAPKQLLSLHAAAHPTAPVASTSGSSEHFRGRGGGAEHVPGWVS